jgi:hypothetical protein
MLMLADYLKQHSPHKPYCTDDLLYGVHIRGRDIALKKRYLQLNSPLYCNWLIFDCDYAGAAFAAQDAGLPDPTTVVITPKNRHAHILYALDTPVFTCDAARLKPVRYVAAIEQAYLRILKADVGYCGLVTKNPLHPDWLHLYGGNAPVRTYTLEQLAECVDLTKHAKQNDQPIGFGRNCMLFDKLRKWAYTAIRRHRGGLRRDSRVVWDAECLDKAVSLNTEFLNPLSFAEVRSIAKSTAKFCWKHDPEQQTAFQQRQSCKGKAGGIQSGKVRKAQNEDKRVSARLMRIQGMTYQQIADELSVGLRTVKYWLIDDDPKKCNEA